MCARRQRESKRDEERQTGLTQTHQGSLCTPPLAVGGRKGGQKGEGGATGSSPEVLLRISRTSRGWIPCDCNWARIWGQGGKNKTRGWREPRLPGALWSPACLLLPSQRTQVPRLPATPPPQPPLLSQITQRSKLPIKKSPRQALKDGATNQKGASPTLQSSQVSTAPGQQEADCQYLKGQQPFFFPWQPRAARTGPGQLLTFWGRACF